MLKLFGSTMIAFAAVGGSLSLARAEAMNAAAPICRTGTSPAILVEVVGIKSNTGTVRVQAYGGRPEHYFDKGSYIERIDMPTARGSEICVPVPKAGTYAISVRHDANANGKSDMKDGGGISGNPHMSIWDLAFKNRPDPKSVQVKVGPGVTPVRIVMNYVQGSAFKPLPSARP
jgi:uncharacterized protein (DUF2141 family)